MNFKYLYPYLKERFPIVNMALFAILFLTVYSLAQFFVLDHNHTSTIAQAGGIIATIFFFFRLRVFDEIKDYQLDIINHPQRVLQSGRITLKELKAIAIVGLLIEASWSIYMGTSCFMVWLIAFGFSLLMRYEFFVAEFLKKKLVLYAITHMLIMPLVILWIWLAFNSEISIEWGYLAFLSLTGGFSFEIARKIHAANAERLTVDSYSKAIGLKGSVLTVLLILLTGIVILFRLMIIIKASLVVYVIVMILFLVTIFMYVKAVSSEAEKKFRHAEILVSLFMLISYLALIIEINF